MSSGPPLKTFRQSMLSFQTPSVEIKEGNPIIKVTIINNVAY